MLNSKALKVHRITNHISCGITGGFIGTWLAGANPWISSVGSICGVIVSSGLLADTWRRMTE